MAVKPWMLHQTPGSPPYPDGPDADVQFGPDGLRPGPADSPCLGRCPGSSPRRSGDPGNPMPTPSSATLSLTRPPCLPGAHRHPAGLGMLHHVGKHLLQAPEQVHHRTRLQRGHTGAPRRLPTPVRCRRPPEQAPSLPSAHPMPCPDHHPGAQETKGSGEARPGHG